MSLGITSIYSRSKKEWVPHMAKEVTLNNGTVVIIKSMPALTVLQMQQQIQKPQVPKYFREDKQREEENPMDPAYIQAVKDYEAKLQDKTVDAVLLYGLEVTKVGDGYEPLESDLWLENTEYLLDVTIPKSGAGRRAAWLKHHVLDDAMDLANLIKEITVASGLATEEAVEQAVESFRDSQGGDTDNTVPTPIRSELTDQPESDSRDNNGVRVQGSSEVHADDVGQLVDFRP